MPNGRRRASRTGLRGLARVAGTLPSEARDIGAEVSGFISAELHVGHLWVWIHQELRDLFRAESGHLGYRGKRRRIVRSSGLIVGDDVAGRAPTPGQRFAVGCVRRQRLRGRSPGADAQGRGRQKKENRIRPAKRVSHLKPLHVGTRSLSQKHSN